MTATFTKLSSAWTVAQRAAFVLACSAAVTPVGAQANVRIDGAAPHSCASCSLNLTKVATLGSINDDEDPGTATISSGISRDSKGQWFVTSVAGDKVIVYSPEGRFVRAIGRKGQGPGELDRAMMLTVGPGDSIHVLDQSRITTFSPSLEYVRSVSAPGPILGPFISFPTGDFAVGMPPFSPGAQPLRLLGSRQPPRPFGQRRAATPSTCSMCGSVLLGPGRDHSRFWAVHRTAYQVSEWRSDGQAGRGVSVFDSRWFTPIDTTIMAGGPTIRPSPVIYNLQEDKAGQIWIEGHVATSAWRPFNRPANDGSRRAANIPIGGGMPPNPERRMMMMTIIEVLDPGSARIVHSESFPGRSLRLVSPEYVAEVREDADGAVVLDIFRAELKRR